MTLDSSKKIVSNMLKDALDNCPKCSAANAGAFTKEGTYIGFLCMSCGEFNLNFENVGIELKE